MKMRLIILFLIVIIHAVVQGQSLPEFGTTADAVNQWVEKNFAKGRIPPFSFVYGGRKSDDFIRNWQYQSIRLKSSEQNAEQSLYQYTDIKSGLVVKCFVTVFKDFPAVEWLLQFVNTSKHNTPVIEKAAVIDYSFVSNTSGSFTLYHAKGSDAKREDFQPIDEVLQLGNACYLTPGRGRSSDNTAFPFFNVEIPGEQGIMVAVGWTGKWYAELAQQSDRSVLLKSGMEKMELMLYPEEEIRTPKICLLFWKGKDRMIGHNQFRRFILAHHTRKINGTFAQYPLSGSFDYGDPAPCGEYECLTGEYAIALVNRYKLFDIVPEVFWLDAGWYTGCGFNQENGGWGPNVGNWTVDKERFPNGLRRVSDAVHNAGAKFMVWFEPERVSPGTKIHREHPEWLLKNPGSENCLFDLGNAKAREWLIDYISEFIKREGIDYYRQDFNMDPYSYWKNNDKPGRVGIHEIKHIEGLYAFWDSLLVRFPNLLIDNCASGGRRIDLETTSRSAPLWRTDYQYGEPNGYQCHTYGLNFYLPIHGTAIYKTDNYTFRSGLGAAAVTNWEITGKDSEPIPAIKKKIQEYKEIRPYFYGDYYPLTESKNNTRDNVWMAYQLNRPEHNDGIALAFRRSQCPNESMLIQFRGLEEEAVYELTYADYRITTKTTGKELMQGIEVGIPQMPASLLIRYRKIPEK